MGDPFFIDRGKARAGCFDEECAITKRGAGVSFPENGKATLFASDFMGKFDEFLKSFVHEKVMWGFIAIQWMNHRGQIAELFL